MSKGSKKPNWVIQKERVKRDVKSDHHVWLFGLHAVRDALLNSKREKFQLQVTKNAYDKLRPAIEETYIEAEIYDPRHFNPPLEKGSVHQGAALSVAPLNWGSLSECLAVKDNKQFALLLDRVSDPHNVGAILRSAEVFGASAVVAPERHAAPETGALAKTASGALERQPYLRVQNLARAMSALREMGYFLIGLDGGATVSINEAIAQFSNHPVALILGAEGPGLRQLTRETCDCLAKIKYSSDFGSLNVSNAAAIAAFLASAR